MSAASWYPTFIKRRPDVWHFNLAPRGEDKSVFPRHPLCGQRSIDNEDWAHGLYTRVPERVTCKRCLKSLARRERLAGEAAHPGAVGNSGDI